MDNNFSELQFKYELATGKDYSQIRSLQLNQIIALSNTQIEPQIIKGMLRLIYETDKWVKNYLDILKRKDDSNGKWNTWKF